MRKKRTVENFSRSGTRAYWGLAVLKACLRFGSPLLYGAVSEKLGGLGPILGWQSLCPWSCSWPVFWGP